MRLTYSIMILLISSFLLFTGCSETEKESQTATKQSQKTETKHQADEHYVCPMHPDEKSDHKANCSICGMFLEKVEPKAETKELYVCPMHPDE